MYKLRVYYARRISFNLKIVFPVKGEVFINARDVVINAVAIDNIVNLICKTILSQNSL